MTKLTINGKQLTIPKVLSFGTVSWLVKRSGGDGDNFTFERSGHYFRVVEGELEEISPEKFRHHSITLQ